MDRLVDRAVAGELHHHAVISRLDKIMADQSAFADKLAELDAVVASLSDLVGGVAAAAPDQAALDQARADGEQAGIDQATAQLAQHIADAQTVLANLQQVHAGLIGGAPTDAPTDAPSTDTPPVDTPVDAPADPAPADPAPSDTPIFDGAGGNIVLGQPGA